MKSVKYKQIYKTIICYMLCGFTSIQLAAQSQVTFRQLSVHDGLSQNSVVSVTQDSIGYLWLATQDGLNKYDGHQFEIYNEFFVDITRPDYSHLGQVYTDNDGNLITVPISKKPLIYNKKKNIFTPFSDLEDVSVIFQDRKKDHWFGTYASGLFKRDFKSNQMVSVLSSKQIKTVFSIVEDHRGTLWITSQGKIMSIDHDGAVQSYFPDGNKDSKVYYSKLIVDDLGDIWLGTYGNGLWSKDGKSSDFKRVNVLNDGDVELPNNLNILSMHLDKKNRLWVGTFGEGLYKLNLNSSQIKHFKVKKQDPRAIGHNDILCIFEDYTGTMWFGTDGAGISFYDEYLEKFNFINNSQTPEGIHIDLVRAIDVDDNNKVWIGTSGKGLSNYSPETNQWKTYVTKNGLSSNRIVSLFTDDVEDELWIGTQEGGLNILQPDGKITHYNHNTSIVLPSETIWSILKDDDRNIWLSTRDKGLIQFDKQKGVVKTIDGTNGLNSNNVRITIPGEKNMLWIGTEEDGLFSFDTKTGAVVDVLKDFQIEDNQLFKKIKSLYYDKKGLLWVGTNGDGLGVFDINNSTYCHYTMEDGLPNNVIYAILPDSENNLWLSSNRGITMIAPPNNFKNKPVIVNYDNYDGLATEFNTGAYFRAKNNTLYFGGLEGFYWFNPADIQKNKVIPKTVLTNFEVFNKSIPLTKDTILNYKQNTLSFTFSSLQFSLPKKNNYRYKLENYDKDWVDSEFTNKVRYTNLPSGSYRFLVKSSNYDGVWNDVPDSLSFIISKPWYWSHWMLFAYVFLSMVLALLTYYYFKWRWKMQLNLKKEKEESVRLKRLDEYKTKLYTNLAHEFRSPLTLITAPIKKQLERSDLKSEAKNDLKLVERNTSQLLNLVDQLLELSRLESGELRLKVKKHDLGLYIRVITESFQFLAEQQGLKLNATIPEIESAWFDADVVEKIVNNLLSNAIKYTSKGGEIYLQVEEDHLGRCKMTFVNDIDGIVERNISKIFNRFHQINENSEGSGIGLSLVKELITLAHGTIEASYVGTTQMKFVINLPMKKETFSENEIDHGIPFQTIGSKMAIASKNTVANTKPIALVVDDNQDIRNFVKSLLKEDFRVIKAKNGDEGIEKAFKRIPDVIISDVVMPIKNGFELCKTLKQDDRTSHIPIIMLTGKTDETDEIMGLDTGADDYITKPFNPRTLQIKIHNIIENRKKLHKRYQQDNLFKPQEIAVTSADEAFLKKVQKILDQHLSDPEFNADTFSKQVGMSRMQLHRKMMAYTGLSTSSFIRSQRLKQATVILQSSDYSINEVGYMIGFNTPSYFIKCFKELYGQTPNEYLKK